MHVYNPLTDLTSIAPASVIFREGEHATFPAEIHQGQSIASASLQNVLDHTVIRFTI